MPLIIAYNICPLIPAGFSHSDRIGRRAGSRQTDYADAHYWRERLGPVLERVTEEFWKLPKGMVTCFFPHDPSVPTAPYPVATIIVDLLFSKPDRTLERRNAYAKALSDACCDFLNEMRHTTNAQVEVAIRSFNPETEGFYVTPPEQSDTTK